MAKLAAKRPHGSALDKALGILETVTGHAQPIGLPELTSQLGLPRQTIELLVSQRQRGLVGQHQVQPALQPGSTIREARLAGVEVER